MTLQMGVCCDVEQKCDGWRKEKKRKGQQLLGYLYSDVDTKRN